MDSANFNLFRFGRSVIPNRCLGCDLSGHFQIRNICNQCFIHLPWISVQCSRCGIDLPDIKPILANQSNQQSPHICGQCISKPPSVDHTFSALKFDALVTTFIIRLKEGKDISAAGTLADLFVCRYQSENIKFVKPDLMIPVPAHWTRTLSRGFNQSELLAREISHQLGLRLVKDILYRTKAGIPQRELTRRQRIKNMQGTFEARKNVKDLNIVVLDDVMTSGATLFSCASQLHLAGAKSVQAWCIARTPMQN